MTGEDVPEGVIAETRQLVVSRGAAALVVDDLREDDLERLGWSGSSLHLRQIAGMFGRRARGEVDYLVVRAMSGWPVAKGGVDHTHERGPGMLWQLATHPALQGLGIGTRLIGALEDRTRARGVESTWLGVEPSNRRARALYERLGYRAYAEAHANWDAQDADGRVYRHETELVLMRKRLVPRPFSGASAATRSGPGGRGRPRVS